MVENVNGELVEIPKGIYHYSEQQHEFDSNYRLPNLIDHHDIRSIMMNMMSGITNTKSTDNDMFGVYIPMPIAPAMRPFNIQVI